MKAIELTGYNGFDSMRVVEVSRPTPAANEVLLRVKAAGINFAELELTYGRYHVGKQLPFIMGFEAAGTVVEIGTEVKDFQVGDKVTAIVSSGGYAEYATAIANVAIPIPEGISFAEAVTIPVQGLSAYTLLTFAAKPQPTQSLLIQAAAGGVGTYLVQLAKILGVEKVVALVSSETKVNFVRSLGADVVINYSDRGWADRVRETTDGKGVDVVLEAASGDTGRESFKLLAPFGRMIVFGAKNIHDTLSSEQIQQLIYKNQTVVGFNFPSLPAEAIAKGVPHLLDLIASRRLRLFAGTQFPLVSVKKAFETLASRTTIGKVVLTPDRVA